MFPAVGETVAIVAVSTSAIVGLSGVLAGVWGGSRERRWRSREERAVELRGVLEDGGVRIAELLIAVDEAHGEVRDRGEMSIDRKASLDAMQRGIVLAVARIGLRRGPRAREYATAGDYWKALSQLVTILEEATGDGLDREQAATYSREWDIAIAAEKGYLDAAAETLTADGRNRRSLRRE